MIKKIIQKVTVFAKGHKFVAVVIVVVIVLVGYFGIKSFGGSSTVTTYVLAAVQKGTLIDSISGSGQVSASNQLDVKPKVSGDVVYVAVTNGQAVQAGQLLVQLDTTDAQKAIRDAQINLENAQISLDKLKISQTSDIPKLQDAITSAQNNLSQAYQTGFNQVSSAFLGLPDIMSGTRGVLYDSTVETSGQTNNVAYQNLIDQDNAIPLRKMLTQADLDYQAALNKYNQNLTDYKNATIDSPIDQMVSLINETLETTKAVFQLAKDEQNILDIVTTSMKQYQSTRSIPKAVTQYQSDISSYIGDLNGYVTNLTNIQSSIISNQQNLASDQRALSDAQANNPLDLAGQANTIEQRQASLDDAQSSLAKYSVRAPFDGTVASVDVKKGDSASSGTAVATVIAQKRIATISVNEVDIANIQLGQKATLTFDAIDGLSIAGEVAEMDAIGTVSQGVVTYNVKIAFDTQDTRVKPGMSVSASIITNVKTDVLLVSSSAIKSSTSGSYVEVPGETIPSTSISSTGVVLTQPLKQQSVEVGSSNDSMTEITSGLKEGDVIVTRTNTSTAKTTTTTSSSVRIPGLGGGGF